MSDARDEEVRAFLRGRQFAPADWVSGEDTRRLELRLPATSANLGPGFDALGLALDFALWVDAELAMETTVAASGHNVDVVGSVRDSLMLETYREVVARERGVLAPPIALTVRNEIPLGMGCGSSAAALVAGVALANHFGGLGWPRWKILAEASRREGHPDNVAACVLGGLVASAMPAELDDEYGDPAVQAVPVPVKTPWRAMVAMPQSSLSTKTARALLPESYSKADAIANVQSVAMLVAAFASGRGDLLQSAMADRMHQPYRSAACPLLPALLPLVHTPGVLGVALSGAGPSVLLVLADGADAADVESRVHGRAAEALPAVEVLHTQIGGGAVLGPSVWDEAVL